MKNYDEKATKNEAPVTNGSPTRINKNVQAQHVPSGTVSSQDTAPQPTLQHKKVVRQVANVQIDELQQVEPTTPKKRGSKKIFLVLLIVVILAIVIVLAGVLKKSTTGNVDESEPTKVIIDNGLAYESTGRYVYDQLQNALMSYDAEVLDDLIGVNPGDSFLAQEWAYINGVGLRQEFVKKLCNQVSFSYPMIAQLYNDGTQVLDASGQPVLIESPMNNGELVTAIVPDWLTMQSTLLEEADYIKRLYEASGYKETDYDYEEKMFNLFCQYIVDRSTMPMTSVEIDIPIVKTMDGVVMIADDSALDNAIFGTDDFHIVLKVFSQICTGWTGFKDEEYVVQVEKHNPEYDEWYHLFISYFEADGGKYNKRKSKWEPWYLRDENNKYVLDENGDKVVNYYSIKLEDGTDWIQPAEFVMVEETRVRQIEDPWVEERGIPYCMVGTYYIQNNYSGEYSTAIRIGDGTIDAPAGIGTEIITQVLCDDGDYHDIKVTLLGYWTYQDAIDYAEKFSAKNKGFTSTSPVKLICYEFSVENLEDSAISFESEMALCDKSANISSRTGSMYGFTSAATLEAGEKVILNDWATSTELEQKYVCWGKSFDRDKQTVFFGVLAGTGEVPTYSAYKQFTGESVMED